MRIIAKHSMNKVLKRDGFQISSEAKKSKMIYPNTIDGTLGTFYYDDGTFKTNKLVHKICDNLKDNDVYLYAPTNGGSNFTESVTSWMFLDYKKDIMNVFNVEAMPTPGGTGAIVNSVFNSLDINETLLIPSPCWGPYVGIAKNCGFNVQKFNLIKDDCFDLDDFIEKSEEIIKTQNKLVYIINDPCNNPTGYTMKEDELNSLISYMNSKKDIPFVFIYDCAYIDMAIEGMNETRRKLLSFTNANDNILIIMTFSASKSFFVYGQRLGAQILLCKDENTINDFINASNYYARNTWSNCNHGMITLIEEVVKSKTYMDEYLKELSIVTNSLEKRARLFIKEADEIGLKTLPYCGGFFITVPCENNTFILDKLIEEEKIYLLPFDNSIRVAICSIPFVVIVGLATRINRVIKKYSNIK